MRFVRLDPALRRWPEVGFAPVVVGIVWAALVVVFLLVKPAGTEATLCLFRNATGLPCPTCGSTRAALAVADGRLLEAVVLNPLMTIAIFVGVVWLTVRVGFARRIQLDLTRPARGLAWGAMALLLAANWVWVIARQGHV
jgi:hypothetical protein